MFPPKPKTRKERQQRMEQLAADLRANHLRISQLDPRSIASEEDLAECRRLTREMTAIGMSEGAYLRAIHSDKLQETKS